MESCCSNPLHVLLNLWLYLYISTPTWPCSRPKGHYLGGGLASLSFFIALLCWSFPTMSVLLAILLSCVIEFVSAQSRFVFGPFYGWRYPDVKSYIARAETTLCPGKTPIPEMQRASMWMGMETENTNSTRRPDLIQAIIVSDPDLYRRYVHS